LIVYEYKVIRNLLAMFEIVTDPYGKAGVVGNIYSYKKYEIQ